MTESSTASDPYVRTPGSAWLSLVAVALGIMVVQIDGTVVSIANPAIAADLDAGPEAIQWVTNAYLLVFAGLLIPAGTVADMIGRKRAFLAGVGGFSAASVLCGLAGSVEVLIAGRVLQAVFAAVLAPAGLAIIRAAFPPERLSMALGWFGSVTAVAMAGGPMLGGLLVQYASWPWVFYLNVPVGVLAVVVGALVVRESARSGSPRLDLAGAATLTAAMTLLVWGVTGAQSSGWTSAHTLGFVAAGLVAFVVFVLVERRRTHPMVPLGLFRDRTFAIATAVMVVTMFAFFALLFYLTFYLQGVRGLGGVEAAVALLPLTAVFTVAAPAAGWAVGRFGVRTALVTGCLCTAVALFSLLRIDLGTGSWALAPSLALAGIGAGLMMIAGSQAVVGSAPVDLAGAASGIQQSAQQLGSTFGVAVLGSVLASAIGPLLPGALARGVPAGPERDRLVDDAALHQDVALGFPPTARDALGDELVATGTAPGAVDRIADGVGLAAHQVFVDGLHVVFGVAGSVTLLAAGSSLLVARGPLGAPDSTSRADGPVEEDR